MEKIIKFSNENKTYNKVLNAIKNYNTIIIDLEEKEIDANFLNYLLKLFRLSKVNDVEIVFLSKNEVNSDFKKYLRLFKNYEEYMQRKVYISFQAKIYMNDEKLRNVLKEELLSNSFFTKERNESNFFNKEHDSRIKDIYIIDFDNYKKRKIEEITKIKEKNHDTIVVLVISSESRELALKMVQLGVDAIIEKPVNIYQFSNMIKKLANESNLKYENIELNNKLREMLKTIENELSLAKDIQQSFLPENNMEYNGYKISYIFEPSQGIGGDFCDVIRLKDDRIAIVFADISGHGIPSALLSSMLKVFIRSEIDKYSKTNLFLENLNEKIITIFPKGKFVSMFYLIIDTKNNTMKYCKASQEPALLLKDKKIIELETEGQVLGVFSKKDFPEMVVFEEKEIEFTKDTTLLLYTDGITESEKNGKMYGIEKLKEEFLNAEMNLEKIKESLSDYDLEDDLTLLTIFRN